MLSVGNLETLCVHCSFHFYSDKWTILRQQVSFLQRYTRRAALVRIHKLRRKHSLPNWLRSSEVSDRSITFQVSTHLYDVSHGASFTGYHRLVQRLGRFYHPITNPLQFRLSLVNHLKRNLNSVFAQAIRQSNYQNFHNYCNNLCYRLDFNRTISENKSEKVYPICIHKKNLKKLFTFREIMVNDLRILG